MLTPPLPAGSQPYQAVPAYNVPSYPPAYGAAPYYVGRAPAEHAGDPRWSDAHVDRVVLVPTAETHPAGTWYFSTYEIVILQAGYALSDRTQLTLTTIPPLSGEPAVPLDLSLKAVLARSRRVRVAAMGSASGVLGLESGEAVVGRVGGAAQLCFDDRCRSSISTAVNLVLGGPLVVLGDGAGAILRASDLFAFLVEVQSVVPIAREAGEIHVLAGAVGARFSGRRWAVDVALEAPLDRRANPAVAPVIVGTYRFLP